MKMRITGLFALLAIPFVAGCSDFQHWLAGETPPSAKQEATPVAGGGVLNQEIWSGPYAEIDYSRDMVARMEGEWRQLWQLVGEPAPGALPEGKMAVAYFAGMRPTAGYAVTLQEVGVVAGPGGGQVLRVGYRVEEPPSDAMTAQVLTYPWAVRLVDATPLPVEFVELP